MYTKFDMKQKILLLLIPMVLCIVFSFAQKIISEGTIVYTISIQTGNSKPQMADALDGATTTVFLKGGLSRTDMVSSLGNESTIYNSQTGEAVILKEYSSQKLMITLTKENWLAKNKNYQGVTFIVGTDTKQIAGYTCKKATAKLEDGSTIIVYYTPDLMVINKEYDQTFKNLPGLAMQYEFQSGTLKFKYVVTRLDFSSVPLAKFDFPKSGYRIMTYDDSQKSK
jgi:GLPGLI family protein